MPPMLRRPLVIFVLLGTSAFANQFVRVSGQVELPLPGGWRLATDSASFPAQLIHQSDSAEVLVFRSEIARDDMIGDEHDLKKSVDLVINEVINTLPEGQLRVSSGFYDGYRTGFTLEFASLDSTSGIPLEHSIKGYIYRLPGNGQVMFTVWGKAASELWPSVRDAIKTVQDGFAYRGDCEKEVFGKGRMSYWPIVLVALALVGLILLRPRKKRPATPGEPVNPS